MLLEIALVVSVLLQFGAFVITISLTKKTRFSISWILISVGFFLMAIRRFTDLIDILNTTERGHSFVFNSWMAVIISVLMLIAAIYIRRIFIAQSRINRLKKENDAKVLSAIIKTEERERHRFAKEIHDGLGPILSSIKMAITALSSSLQDEKAKQIADKTNENVNAAISAVKEVSNKLSPHILERYGLEKAITAFKDSIVTTEKLEIEFRSDLQGQRFEYNTEVILYRIVCELISNTLKHADASKINITLFCRDDLLEFQYNDNGKGFNINTETETGLGLSNIQSRVKSVDGILEIHTKPNKGFFLKIILNTCNLK